ncbi:maltooligosyl trehalose synthase [Yimella lutea]|uniref:Maltooligosyl trehalose synthase n=2 Tax=Yimella lutea TaxID=587872 RepID=A0A542EKH8_9MICO|nr:maltooligosyl trehalose synthase [Yimella lutea]
MGAMPFTSTYRLQLHSGFTFADAAQQVPYLAELGISHLYLSPILTAVPGSMHGYDVVDHTRINPELGGEDGFRELAEKTHALGLGIVVDVVPNHMAFVAPEYLNRPLWEVLRDGRDASTEQWFDIDWKVGGGRIGLPVLGRSLAEVLEAGELTLDTFDSGEPVLRYYEHVWPVALGTEEGDVAQVLDRQHYRLASWREKDEVLNYRRFFEVDGLIAVRVELPEVFDATHELLVRLHHEGLIDGFRIDHPDGLADPSGYLERLTSACKKDTPIWTEKILEGDERLPTDWKCAGTTGYDALRVVQAAFTDSASADVLDETWIAAGGNPDFHAIVQDSKRWIVTHALAPEVDRLTRRAREALPDLDPERLREAVVELLVAGEVYRAYVQPDQRLTPAARARLREAFTAAVEARPQLQHEIESLIPVTLLADDDESATDFAIRLQQTWGPVMAKGIEDTTFYRYHRLVALNEVGSDPTLVAGASPDLLHQWAVYQQRNWPRTMTSLSTHDTKRSEDVRARILAVAGEPSAWQELSASAAALAQGHIDGPTAHLVWQTLFGVGEIDDERLTGYLEKALREGKEHTAWVDGDAEYEARVIAFAERLRDDAGHSALSTRIEADLAESIRAITLGTKLIQLMLPGVPDTYQGTEYVNLSLVDPDNRRPVEYSERAQTLGTHETPDLDSEKQFVVQSALLTRQRHPEVFGDSGGYTPIESDSPHLLGFVRNYAPGLVSGVLRREQPAAVAVLATRTPSRLALEGGWADATVELPEGTWTDLLSGRLYDGGRHVRCADLFTTMPVALLELAAS